MKSNYFQKLKYNKKGSEVDIIYFVIFLFAAGIFLMLMYRVFSPVYEQISRPSQLGADTQERVREISGAATRTMVNFNWLYIMILGGMFVSVILSSFFIDTHPVLFFTFLIGAVVILLVAPLISNTYNRFSASANLGNSTITFPFIDNVTNNLPIWMFFLAIVMAITLYAKFKFFRGEA